MIFSSVEIQTFPCDQLDTLAAKLKLFRLARIQKLINYLHSITFKQIYSKPRIANTF